MGYPKRVSIVCIVWIIYCLNCFIIKTKNQNLQSSIRFYFCLIKKTELVIYQKNVQNSLHKNFWLKIETLQIFWDSKILYCCTQVKDVFSIGMFLVQEGPPWLGALGETWPFCILKQVKIVVLALKIWMNFVLYVRIFRAHNFHNCFFVFSVKLQGNLILTLNTKETLNTKKAMNTKIFLIKNIKIVVMKNTNIVLMKNTNIVLMNPKAQVCMS